MKGATHPVIVAIAVVALAFIVTSGQLFVMVAGWLDTALGIPRSCNEAPYSENCFCSSGYDKIYVPWIGVAKWACEPAELYLDPDSGKFEEESINFVKGYLSIHCASISPDISCGSICSNGIYPQSEAENPCIAASWGYSSSGERIVNTECMVVDEWHSIGSGMPSSGHLKWSMRFLVASLLESDDTPKAYDISLVDNYATGKSGECSENSGCAGGALCSYGYCTKRCAPPDYCEYYGNPEWCVPDLPINFIPAPVAASIFGYDDPVSWQSGRPSGFNQG